MPSRKKDVGDLPALSEKQYSRFTDTVEQNAVNVSVSVSVSISRAGYEGLDECAKRYKTSKSHIADLVFSNLHKLRLVDIVEEPEEIDKA